MQDARCKIQDGESKFRRASKRRSSKRVLLSRRIPSNEFPFTSMSAVRGAQSARLRLARLQPVVDLVLLLVFRFLVVVGRRCVIRPRPRRVADAPQHVATPMRAVPAVEAVVAAAGRRGATQRQYCVLPVSHRDPASGQHPLLAQQAAARAPANPWQAASAASVVDHCALQQPDISSHRRQSATGQYRWIARASGSSARRVCSIAAP